MSTPIRYTANPPKDISARVYHSVNQSVANITWVALAFDSERWDTDGIHDPSTNNTRLTCKTAGRYLVTGVIRYASNNAAERDAVIKLNGTTNIAQIRTPAVQNYATYVQVTTIYDLAVNDYVELIAFQRSGGSLNAEVSASDACEFMMAKIRG